MAKKSAGRLEFQPVVLEPKLGTLPTGSKGYSASDETLEPVSAEQHPTGEKEQAV